MLQLQRAYLSVKWSHDPRIDEYKYKPCQNTPKDTNIVPPCNGIGCQEKSQINCHDDTCEGHGTHIP